jgi:hypothetical protein
MSSQGKCGYLFSKTQAWLHLLLDLLPLFLQLVEWRDKKCSKGHKERGKFPHHPCGLEIWKRWDTCVFEGDIVFLKDLFFLRSYLDSFTGCGK